MTLKDATPFNLQMVNGKMKWIDTSSFSIYEENSPWIAYNQFCQTFLAPLLLMHYVDADAAKMMQVYPNGLSMKKLKSYLPTRARLNLSNWMHVYLQASIKPPTTSQTYSVSKYKLQSIVDDLTSHIQSLQPNYQQYEWEMYYHSNWLTQDYVQQKTTVLQNYLEELDITDAIDFGCNTGEMSSLLAQKCSHVLAIDSSVASIDNLYDKIKKQQYSSSIIPVVMDISNPTSSAGFMNLEYQSFEQRAKADLVTAFALIHHLCITKNISIHDFIQFLLIHTERYLIVEFVPITDANAQHLLKNRNMMFSEYTQQVFENELNRYCRILNFHVLSNGRIVYLTEKL